jgi:DNA/RNA endonuclease G (NUC1)
VLNQGEVFHYPTYSVVANSSPDKRSPVIVCLNIDQALLKGTSRSDRWRIDPRIQFENQLDNDYYAFNPWDRGHMARRTSAAWGSSMRDAQYAADETFYYSNSALQHANLNQDEWLGLEDWVFGLELDKDGKITSFSGPIYGDFDRSIRPSGRRTALVPAGFFKVVCFINKDTEQLDVRAFVIYQDAEALADKSGRTRYDNQHYQVTVTEIEELTGPSLRSRNSRACASMTQFTRPTRFTIPVRMRSPKKMSRTFQSRSKLPSPRIWLLPAISDRPSKTISSTSSSPLRCPIQKGVKRATNGCLCSTSEARQLI